MTEIINITVDSAVSPRDKQSGVAVVSVWCAWSLGESNFWSFWATIIFKLWFIII